MQNIKLEGEEKRKGEGEEREREREQSFYVHVYFVCNNLSGVYKFQLELKVDPDKRYVK